MRLCLCPLLLLGLPGLAGAAETPDAIWPQCSDHSYEITVDQVIRPEWLTARRALVAMSTEEMAAAGQVVAISGPSLQRSGERAAVLVAQTSKLPHFPNAQLTCDLTMISR